MATPRIRKVMKGRIHEVFGIHRFFRFGDGESNYLTVGFWGFYGVCGYTDPLIRAILLDFGNTRIHEVSTIHEVRGRDDAPSA